MKKVKIEYELPSDLRIGKRDEKKMEKKIKVFLKMFLYFLLGYLGVRIIFLLVGLHSSANCT